MEYNINNDTAETDRFHADVTVQALEMRDEPETLSNDLFMPGYLRTQIGRYMRVEFLIGNQLTDITGKLMQVGASYIILELLNKNLTVCDIYGIKFVTIYENPTLVMRK